MEFSINKNPEIIKKVLKDDGTFPNSQLPVLIYKNALTLPEEHAAIIIEDIFKKITGPTHGVMVFTITTIITALLMRR